MDRVGAHVSNVPCCICNSTVGIYDTYCTQYRVYTDTIQEGQSMMKSVCRTLLQFPPGSVFRLLPAISILGNAVLNSQNNQEHVISILQKISDVNYSEKDKDIISFLLRFCQQLGPNFVMITPVESGCREFDKEVTTSDIVKLPTQMKNFALKRVYGIDILHKTSNVVKEIINFSYNTSYIACDSTK